MSDPVPGTVEPHHRLGLYERCYAQVESGRKTIKGRVRTPPRMTGVAVGDVLVFRGEESGRIQGASAPKPRSPPLPVSHQFRRPPD